VEILLYKTPAQNYIVNFDESLIDEIIDSNPSWSVMVRQKEFIPDLVDIYKSMIPVKKPGARGGVYFSETEAYKVRCSIADHSIVKLLTSTMLGPSVDFTPIQITATSGERVYLIKANLTNYVQTKTEIQLNLVVVDVSS